MNRFDLVLFVVLLFMPMAAAFVFIHGYVDVLLRDTLFLVGFMLLVLGSLSGEYIWSFIKNYGSMRKDHNYPTELMVGLALLAAGAVYIAVAVLLPAEMFL